MTNYAVITGLTADANPFGNVTLNWATVQTLTTTFTASGSYANPGSAITQIRVRALGGGAGGGGGAFNFGPGYNGYGGAYADAYFNPASLTFPVTVTVGAAGVGAAAGTVNGTDGGQTSFGSYVVCPGGVSYNRSNTAATVTGATSFTTELGGSGVNNTGTWNTTYAGAAGANAQGTGNPSQAVTGGIASGGGPGGNGGSVGAAVAQAGANNGGPGANYGAGGAGGAYFSNSFYGNGGNGSPGIVIVTATYPVAQSFDVYRNGVLIGTTTGLTWTDPSPPSGLLSYEIIPVSNGAEVTSGAQSTSVTATPLTYYADGAFAGSKAYPPVMLANAKGIEPKIYMPQEATTIKG